MQNMLELGGLGACFPRKFLEKIDAKILHLKTFLAVDILLATDFIFSQSSCSATFVNGNVWVDSDNQAHDVCSHNCMTLPTGAW